MNLLGWGETTVVPCLRASSESRFREEKAVGGAPCVALLTDDAAKHQKPVSSGGRDVFPQHENMGAIKKLSNFTGLYEC